MILVSWNKSGASSGPQLSHLKHSGVIVGDSLMSLILVMHLIRSHVKKFSLMSKIFKKNSHQR